MKLIKIFIAAVFFFLSTGVTAQIENVPLEDDVYNFLRKMSVKKIIGSIHDDNPNMSKDEITSYLNQIDDQSGKLSVTDRQLLKRYKTKLDYDYMSDKNSFQLIKSDYGFKRTTPENFIDKEKYLYTYRRDGNSLFVKYTSSGIYSNEIKPKTQSNVKLFDFGIRINGTLFNKLGYDFGVDKGGVLGDADLAVLTDPRLEYNFKFVENLPDEKIRSYDFATGYLKYESKPMDDMRLSVQLGREKITYGLGYTNSLILSGQHPLMDFVKFSLQYGIVNFSSMTISTVGEFNRIIDSTFTKYIALNRLMISIPDFVDLGIGEAVVYARPFELAYLNPVIFYKFVEMSLQDRDNGAIFFDLQTHFIKGLQFQATYFMDENILDSPFDFSKATNKTAMQFGMFTYEPFGFRDFSFFAEYTFIRPYVYSHITRKATFTSWSQIIGNDIGPNADQIVLNSQYNFSDKLKLTAQVSRTRKGFNIVDENGSIIKNVGGDVFVPYRVGIDDKDAPFLDGERVYTDEIRLSLKYEPVRNFIFNLNYIYRQKKNFFHNTKSDISFAYLKFRYYL